MGGNALKEYGSKRLETEKFKALSVVLIEAINSLLIECDINAPARLIESYREKPTHGDIDIVVPSGLRQTLTPEEIAQALMKKLGVSEFPYKANGPVVSFGFPLGEGGVFQVDLISAPLEEIDFSVSYFAWNDVGNLIGRIAHKMGLRFGHDGLALPLRDGTNMFDVIMITRDYREAIEFLGFSYERWAQGFNNLEEIFQFTVSAPRFSRSIYLLENRNHTARVRDKKRPTYTAFLAWLEQHPEVDRDIEWPEDKSHWLEEIFTAFPKARSDYEESQVRLSQQKVIKRKFNGKMLMDITGLGGNELGGFKTRYQQSFDSLEAFNEFMFNADDESIKESVIAFVKRS